MTDFTLVINAGGQSRRMGTPKALLPVPPHATPMIAYMAARLDALAPAQRVVVANDPRIQALAQLPPETLFVADAYPDTGTLGGIATGLQHAPGWAVVVACDLPFVCAELLRSLLALAAEQAAEQTAEQTAEQAGGRDRWDAIVPVVNGYEQPLHAVYHRRCLPAIEACLAAGQRRVISFMPAVRTRYVQEGELRRFDPELRSFFNANTPEEWAEARRLLALT